MCNLFVLDHFRWKILPRGSAVDGYNTLRSCKVWWVLDRADCLTYSKGFEKIGLIDTIDRFWERPVFGNEGRVLVRCHF